MDPELFDVDAVTEPYFTSDSGIAEFVQFQYRFAAVIWLYRTLTNSVGAEVRALRMLRESGRHRVPEWEGESDMVLDEAIGVLKHDAAQISAGTIIATCSSALESLLSDLLPEASPHPHAPRGLVPRAQALVAGWPDDRTAEAVLEHVRWLAKRRNSFAHRLIDEGGHWDPTGTKYEFDEQLVEETFERVGEAVTILSDAYDQ